MPLAAALLLVVITPQEAPPAPPPQAVTASEIPAPGPATAAIVAGQAAFRKRRFRAARADFEKAVAADPQSAAAAFYLGYTCYKLGEPSRRMNENKERARELFATAFTLDPEFRPDWGSPPVPGGAAPDPPRAPVK
jgi:tetratricopeptide (TPR) repeat protein